MRGLAGYNVGENNFMHMLKGRNLVNIICSVVKFTRRWV